MELTAATVREVQFRQSWKGYDTAEVDDFLDAVAAGIAQLHERLSTSGVAQPLAVPAPAVRSESDESVRRTLVLAQRAADLVVSEAKSVADRIVADAHAESARIVTAGRAQADQSQVEARQKVDVLMSEAHAAADRQTATRAAELQESLQALATEHGRRQLELEQLQAQVEAYRAQVRQQLAQHMAELDGIVTPPNPVTLGMGGASEP